MGTAMLHWLGLRIAKRPDRSRANTIAPHESRVELPNLGMVEVRAAINCIGDVCPRPQLMTLKVLERIAEGEVVELQVDSPGAREAIYHMATTLCVTCLAVIKHKDHWRVYLRKDPGWDSGAWPLRES